jgi:hypothetical protein
VSEARRRFIVQAHDPDHGYPVLEALFAVERLDDLRTILGAAADDDLELRNGYFLEAGELAMLLERFDVRFDAGGRQAYLTPWTQSRDIPYLIHTGYELPLLLEGRKQLARMCDTYPPEKHWGEDYFDPYVAKGLLHKEVIREPFDQAHRLGDGRVFQGLRTVYYTRIGEEWRIRACELVWSAARRSRWNDDFERLEGMLYGYEGWQIDCWIEHRHKLFPK